jgi:hypothetical protein
MLAGNGQRKGLPPKKQPWAPSPLYLSNGRFGGSMPVMRLLSSHRVVRLLVEPAKSSGTVPVSELLLSCRVCSLVSLASSCAGTLPLRYPLLKLSLVSVLLKLSHGTVPVNRFSNKARFTSCFKSPSSSGIEPVMLFNGISRFRMCCPSALQVTPQPRPLAL